ncbi:uncharacterized protein CBL_02478 [Carabus blaptoides fortunei]
MERWSGKVAVVTGASAGIGAAIVEKLVKSGLQVAGFARRAELVEDQVKNLSNIAGHQVTHHDPPAANVYPASKHAVTALTESLRQEMVYLKNKIKVTSISPGLTYTDMFHIGNSERFHKDNMAKMPYLLPEDVADAVMYVLGTPPHVQIHELTIKPVGEEV